MPVLEHQIPPFARELTALFVEDDAASRLVMAAQLRGVFKELILAADGQEGLTAFRARRPQLVLTDNRMPFMSGIEMTEAIRQTDAKVPVIFITSAMDTSLMVQAINLGISAFIPKPAAPDNLRQAVALVVGMLEIDHLQRKTLEQELALLQFREKYHEFQQELAFRKELSILENDYLCRCFPGDSGSARGEWIAQVVYAPHDIMCGDSYSMRRLPEGMLLLIADAMGKGLAASLTTSLSAHAFNFLADAVVAGEPFRFEAFVQRYTALMRKRLLEDEVLPMALAWLPNDRPVMATAAFGMPPILVTGFGDVRKLRCNNPPLSPYADTFSTTEHDLGAARSILFYTDGLNEAVTGDGSLYRDHLDGDFLASASRDQLWSAFQSQVGSPDDDVALLRLSRVDGPALWRVQMEVQSRLEAVDEACQELEHRLAQCATLAVGPRGEFAMAIREAMLNAYEHGSLEIDFQAKRRMLEDGVYYQHLLDTEPSVDRRIRVDLAVQAHHAGQHLLKVTILDEGPGFTPPSFLFQEADSMLLCGRGLKMVKKYTDAFYLNEKGNAITLLRIYPGGSDAVGANQSH
jgi:CheY-like chemotaxis protein